MKVEEYKNRENGLKKFDRFKLETRELHSIKGSSFHFYYIDGVWYVVWVDD